MKSKIVLPWLGIVIVIFVGVLISWKMKWVNSIIFTETARRKIYPLDSMETRYPGVGENRKWAEERLWVVPRGMGKPKYVSLTQREQYPPSEYEVIAVPAQEEWYYTVGMVGGWEEIAGSADKYLLVTYRGAEEKVKYRILMESDGQNGDGTVLAVEDVEHEEIDVANVENVGLVGDLDEKVLTKIIKSGDAVVILPVWEPPVVAKQDEQGNYLVSWLVVRRAGGRDQLVQEMRKAGGGQ